MFRGALKIGNSDRHTLRVTEMVVRAERRRPFGGGQENCLFTLLLVFVRQ